MSPIMATTSLTLPSPLVAKLLRDAAWRRELAHRRRQRLLGRAVQVGLLLAVGYALWTGCHGSLDPVATAARARGW